MFHRNHIFFIPMSINTIKSLLTSKYKLILIYKKEKLNNSMSKFSSKSTTIEVKC